MVDMVGFERLRVYRVFVVTEGSRPVRIMQFVVVIDPGYMSRKIRNLRTDLFDT